MASRLIVPPGGFAGFSQMTVASRRALGGGPMRGGARRRARSAARASPRRARSAPRRARAAPRRARASGRKLKFGSPAFNRKHRVGQFRKRR